jgi:hypothetical protein
MPVALNGALHPFQRGDVIRHDGVRHYAYFSSITHTPFHSPSGGLLLSFSQRAM